MSTNVADALASVPMLSTLDRRHLEKLARDFSEKTFPAGSVVVREGDDHGMGFFVEADGEAVASVRGTELHCYVMTLWDFRSFVQGDPR